MMTYKLEFNDAGFFNNHKKKYFLRGKKEIPQEIIKIRKELKSNTEQPQTTSTEKSAQNDSSAADNTKNNKHKSNTATWPANNGRAAKKERAAINNISIHGKHIRTITSPIRAVHTGHRSLPPLRLREIFYKHTRTKTSQILNAPIRAYMPNAPPATII